MYCVYFIGGSVTSSSFPSLFPFSARRLKLVQSRSPKERERRERMRALTHLQCERERSTSYFDPGLRGQKQLASLNGLLKSSCVQLVCQFRLKNKKGREGVECRMSPFLFLFLLAISCLPTQPFRMHFPAVPSPLCDSRVLFYI